MTVDHKKEQKSFVDKMLAKFRKPQSRFAALMPLNALALSACGGGDEEAEIVFTSVNGTVLKGQITNALVFSDLNSNGVFDVSEPNAYTDENGQFNLSTSDASAKLIALGQAGSIDKSTGASGENINFSGTSSGTVISPFSTVITEGGMSSKELADSLGLGDVDLLNFNPFAGGVDAATALLVEKTSHQLENVINSFTEVTKGSGLTAAQAKEIALDSFAAVAKEKLALKETIDLSKDADVTAISANITKSITLTVAEAEALTTKLNTASTALKNVNTEVKAVVELTSDVTKGVFSLGQLLKDQIAENILNGANIDLVDSAKVTLAATNLAPSEIKITSSKITENATDLAVGTFSAKDEDSSSLVYGLAGTDAGKFYLSETGELSLKAVANFEAQSSYSLVLNVKDAGGKKSASKFEIEVENVNDVATGSVEIMGNATQGAVLTADTSKIIDEDSTDIASIAEYQWLRDGVEITGATSKEFTLSQSDVASALSLNVSYNDGSDTTETFSSSATAQVENVNDAPSGILKISGTPAQEDILTADTSGLSDTDGLGAFSYQWMRDGTAISGETNTTLALSEVDVGKKISVTVTYSDQQGTAENITSASTNAIANKNDGPTGSLVLSGSNTESTTLHADASGIADADGLGNFTFTWFRDGEEITNTDTWSGGNVSVQELVMSDSQIQERKDVTGSEKVLKIYISQGGDDIVHNRTSGEELSKSLTPEAWQLAYMRDNMAKLEKYIDIDFQEVFTKAESDTMFVIHPVPNKDSISSFGEFKGSTLMMSHSGGLDSPLHLETDPTKVVHTDQSKATQIETFLHELGHLIGLEHPWDMKDGDNDQAVLTSDDLHTATQMGYGGQALNGEYTRSGEEGWFYDIDMAALISIWGAASATKSQFEVLQEDVGKIITAKVTYIDKGGVTETATSNATSAIQNINNEPTGSIIISGDVKKGATLTLDTTSLKDGDGLGTLSTFWKADGNEIFGATGTTYVLTSSEVGKAISAEISYTDGFGAVESVISTGTAKVTDALVESIGAISVINSGTKNAPVLDFYLDEQSAAGLQAVPGKGSLTATGSALYDRTMDVFGVKLLVGGASGSQAEVPDAWAHKVAQSYVMLMDPTASNIDVYAQENMKKILAGEEGTWHEGSGTSQRILKGASSEYPLNPLQDFNYGELDAQYGSGTEALLNNVMQDMIWYQNSTGVIGSGDGDIQELFEHAMHTLHPWGVRGAVEGSAEALNYTKTGSLNPHDANDSSWKTSELYLAFKEATDNGVLDPSGYAADPLNNPEGFMVAAIEYTYLLNFSMWEMGKEFWPDKNSAGDGSLLPEWSDLASTPAGVLAENPLGYALFNTYFTPVLSKPDFTTLRSMFQDNDQGLSGYVPYDANDVGVNALDVILTFDPTAASFTSFSYANGFIGAANEGSSADGNITFGAIAISGISTDNPLFTMTMSDLDSSADFLLTVSDLNVDGSILDGSTLIV